MCAIAGYLTTKKYSTLAQAKLTRLLLAGEVRGRDACGIGFNLGNNRFYFLKSAQTASKFIQIAEYKKALKSNPTLLIAHNRLKTQGDPANNKNNHPIVSKKGLLLVHNGIISNDWKVKEDYKLEVDGEVDSAVVLKLIEHFIYDLKFDTVKAIQLAAKKLRGSMNIALLRSQEPNTLYLLNSGTSLCVAYHIPTKTIYFGSTKEILKEALEDTSYYFHGLFSRKRDKGQFLYTELPEDTGLKITYKGFKTFTVKRPTFASSYNYTAQKSTYPRTTFTLPSQKPLDVEKKGEIAIVNALRKCTDFEPFNIVKKPKKLITELLMYRLEAIQDCVTVGTYSADIFTGDEILKVQSETRRIISTLQDREKKTDRKGIYIPSYEDVWKYRTKPVDPSEVEWVLTMCNKKLMANLIAAEIEIATAEELKDGSRTRFDFD